MQVVAVVSPFSLKMYLITVAGLVTWLIYGLLLRQWAIIAQNIICLCQSSFILTMKLLPQKKEAMADSVAAVPGAEPDPPAS